MPKSLLSDYSAREITGEVLLHETRACFLTALGSCHWTKSNKSTLPSRLHVTARAGGGCAGKRVDSKKSNVSKIREKKKKNPTVDLLSLFQLHLPFMVSGL